MMKQVTGHQSEQVPNDSMSALDRTLRRILMQADWLKLFTPTNLVSERREFLERMASGERYEPRFVYQIPDLVQLQHTIDELRRFEPFDIVPHPLRQDYQSLVEEVIETVKMVRAFAQENDEDLMERASTLFGHPNHELLAAAQAIISSSDTPIRVSQTNPHEQLNASIVADAIKERLRSYGINKWHIKLTRKSVARMSVNALKHTITIHQDARFTKYDIAKLQTHEIDTHVLRAENGRRGWTAGIFEIGFRGSEEVDEGMALLNERSQGVSPPESKGIVALHVLGIDFAARHAFSESFEWVHEYFPDDPQYAFGRVLRWKRGFRHQHKPAAFAKDLVYYRGIQTVSKYIESGGSLTDLYRGRIDLGRTPNQWKALAEQFGMAEKNPPILPHFMRF